MWCIQTIRSSPRGRRVSRDEEIETPVPAYIDPDDRIEPAEIAARYGRTRSRRVRGRVFAIGGTIAALVVAGTWVVWAGLDGDSATIQATDTGHEVIDDTAVTVDWNLSAPAGASVRCAIQAMNADFRTVGWKVVDVPPSDTAIRPLSDTVRTTELATTGLISSCWLT
ncbi:hypothetical protein B5808_11325 [Cnuibacter physcomitrellae]|uniref:DUF4307 domain-containing protein n=1 Tax=Cnuibacter physcomitrellae TaxID=1619308 RepID=A0A1X9LKV2_9MICO|nr:hypothetical protein B5808_11325 [Cnuibacter physcomitrellae]